MDGSYSPASYSDERGEHAQRAVQRAAHVPRRRFAPAQHVRERARCRDSRSVQLAHQERGL
jgi:hypothetical protein